MTNEKMEEVATCVKKQVGLAKKNKNGQNVITPLSAADELKKYKDLLDAGAITQEEFDQKKKQPLNG